MLRRRRIFPYPTVANSGISPRGAIVRAVRENPRPTRHLEHVEPGQIGKPLPGSIGGPAWDLVAVPDPPGRSEPTSSGDADGAVLAVPSGTGSRKRSAIAVSGAVLVVLALSLGGWTVLRGDRPEDADATTAVERAALELPFLTPDTTASDRPDGPKRRAETQTRRTDQTEAGDDAVVSQQGDTTATSGTQTGQAGQGDTTGNGAGTGTQGGTGSSTDPGTDPGTGSGGGGTTTPTAAPPPPTSDPTTKPTTTPEPTPSPSDEPTPDPTPSPSASPSQEPTGTPVPPDTEQ
jgi:hypothetical protein